MEQPQDCMLHLGNEADFVIAHFLGRAPVAEDLEVGLAEAEGISSVCVLVELKFLEL